jgi:Integrase core domain
MGRAACSVDNTMTESFWSTMQRELLDTTRRETKHQLSQAIFEWIEAWYNPRRRHTSISDLSPVAYEHCTVCDAASAAEGRACGPHHGCSGGRSINPGFGGCGLSSSPCPRIRSTRIDNHVRATTSHTANHYAIRNCHTGTVRRTGSGSDSVTRADHVVFGPRLKLSDLSIVQHRAASVTPTASPRQCGSSRSTFKRFARRTKGG